MTSHFKISGSSRVSLVRLSLLAAALFGVAGGAGGCSLTGNSAWNGVHASAGLGLQEVNLTGSIDTDTEVSPGVFVTTEFDLEDNGGQDSSQQALYASAQVGLAPIEFRVSAFEYSNDASGIFTGDFLGTPFTGPVDTKFDIQAYKGTIGIDLLNLERLRIGALIGATVLDLDLRVSSSLVPGTEETLDELVPAPVIGGRADFKITGWLRVGGELTLLPIDEIEDFEVSFLDYEVGIHIEPFPYLEIFGLYRSLELEVEGDIDGSNASVDMGMSGPVFGVAITF